ncbi:MAG: efflux RND transporter periplasmic adaptor subunit, partial [Planctomycetes bacterium]|nr:efflux RND transporter periplasmic adaptor subunit [Planctomycetota bacterium]
MPQENIKIKALIWELKGLAVVLAAGAFIIAVLFGMIAMRKSSIETERAESEKNRVKTLVPVVVTELKSQPIEDVIFLPGRIEAWTNIKVPAEVGGQIIKTKDTPVDDGAIVKKGQPLLQIEKKDYEISLQDAKASLELARQNYNRTLQLVKKGVRTPADRDQDKSTLDRTTAAYEAAKLALERTTIRSPIDGTADNIIPEIGEYLKPGDMVASVLELDRMKVEIGIPEKDVDVVRQTSEGKEVSLKVDAIRDADDKPLFIKGKCNYISKQPLEQAFIYLMRLEVGNKDGRLQPGMFCEASVVRGVRPEAIVVDMFSILTKSSGEEENYYVYVAEEAPAAKGDNEKADAAKTYIAKRRKVELGIMMQRKA